MKISFFKMHAQGNDYLYFDLRKNAISLDWHAKASQWCQRQKGVGADGIVLISQSQTYDATMRIFNADGSEAEMCGSALRCVCAYLFQNSKKEILQIQTKAGLRTGWRLEKNNDNIEVWMGNPIFIENYKQPTSIQNKNGYVISVGNPHFVYFEQQWKQDQDFYKTGNTIEMNTIFSERINVHQVQKINHSSLKMRIWERGSGATLSCGTGACAAAFAAIHYHNCEPKLKINVPGGIVYVRYNKKKNDIYLSGICSFVFNGELDA